MILDKRGYLLQRRLQFVATLSTLIAAFVVTAGTMIIRHIFDYDVSHENASRILDSLIAVADPANDDDSSRADAQQYLSTMTELNPGAWYYYELGDQIYTNGPGEPRYQHRLIREEVKLLAEGDQPELCASGGEIFEFDGNSGRARIIISGCGESTYYAEIEGFERGLPVVQHAAYIINQSYFVGTRFQRIVLPVVVLLVVVVGAISVLFGLMMSHIREVSQAAARIGVGQNHVTLPENDLPREILPMVQAINGAISRLESKREQQSLFVAAAAHELRTPLAVHRSKIEELPDSELKDELGADVIRMGTMITQLLTLARLDASENQFEELALAGVVRDTCIECGGAAYDMGKKLAFDDGHDSISILGDRGAVQTAVMNLIDNALAFTPNGRTVNVAVKRNRVIVKDDGPGVAVQNRDQVFEPFFKYPPSRRGHGLGLAIVSEIMRLHRGSVSTRNHPDGGAIFELEFPEPTTA